MRSKKQYRYLEGGKDVWKFTDRCLYKGRWKKVPISFIGKLVAPSWHGLGRRKEVLIASNQIKNIGIFKMTNDQKNEIFTAIEIFRDNGSWIPLAKLLSEAKIQNKNEDFSFTGLKNNANRMIAAYQFLEVRRPDILETPEEILGQFRAFACLPTLSHRLERIIPDKNDRDKRLDAILEKVIRNEIPTYIVERYATTLTDESKRELDSYVMPTHRQKFEEELQPPSESVKNAIKEYKAGGHWLLLVKHLVESKDNHEDLSKVDISPNHINRMITAFRYVEVKRPALLEKPEELKASITSLSLLPSMSGRLPPETIDDYFEKVISGGISEKKLGKISSQLAGSNPQSVQSAPLEESESIKIGETFENISKTLNMLIQKYSFESLRKDHAKICDDLATQFRCVADPGYKKQWDERKEGKL